MSSSTGHFFVTHLLSSHQQLGSHGTQKQPPQAGPQWQPTAQAGPWQQAPAGREQEEEPHFEQHEGGGGACRIGHPLTALCTRVSHHM